MPFGQMDITAVTRVQDFATIKHNEDHKAVIDQSNIGHQIQKETDLKPTQINESDNAQWHSKQFDARSKGDNQYSGDGGQNRKKEHDKESDKASKDRVVVKGQHGFDIKI